MSQTKAALPLPLDGTIDMHTLRAFWCKPMHERHRACNVNIDSSKASYKRQLLVLTRSKTKLDKAASKQIPFNITWKSHASKRNLETLRIIFGAQADDARGSEWGRTGIWVVFQERIGLKRN
jgi:hypothetical protein